MSAVPTRNFLYFIVDRLNRSKYVDNGGVVRTSSLPVPLKQDPKGWKDIKVSFGTNQAYWCLNRSFSAPMEFINDGAQILREALYSGRGYEEELYVRIFKKNEDNGNMELEYHGRIDFSKHVDEPRHGITVNTIEGGPLSYLTANDGVSYEIPLAANNLDAWITNIDGVTLFDRYRYSIINQQFVGSGSFIGKRFAVNFPFISNEGDSVGVIQGSQTYEDVGVSIQTYTQTSANYFFSSIRPIQVRITGQIKFDVVVVGSAPTNQASVYFQFRTGPYPTFDNQYTVLGTPAGINPNPIIYTTTQSVIVNVDTTINLAQDEKLFFIGFVGINGGGANSVNINLTDLYVEFKTKNPESTTYSMDIITIHKKLVSLMTEGRFQGDSVFFSKPENKRIQWTSTNALQNFAFQVYYGSFDTIVIGSAYFIKVPGTFKPMPSDNQIIITGAASNNGVYEVLNIGPLISGFTTIQVREIVTAATGLSGTITTIPNLKITYKDFFGDVNCLYNIGMQIRNNVIYIEPKQDIYKPDIEIFDIGEIANFKLKYCDELLCNTGKFGYKSQDYRQRNGIYEFNTTTEFKFPVNTLKRVYEMILKARGDCFGIEFIRSIIFNKPTTDVTGDNQAFIIDTTLLVKSVTPVDFAAVNGTMILPAGILVSVGDQYQITGSSFNNNTYTVTAIGTLSGNRQLVFLTGAPVVDETAATITLTLLVGKTRMVYRPNYSALVGVLDNTVYNTEWTPHKLMLQHKNMLRALLKEQDAFDITFQTADKNSALSTTLFGVTVAERQNETVSSLGDPLFMNRYGQFTTRVPIPFSKIMSNLGTGYVKGTFYGVPIYFLPIGQMDAKPATNAAQSWTLLLSPNNDPEVLKMLSAEGIFTTDVMGNSIFTTDLNTLHFNRYGYTLPAKYQHKDMYDAQFQDRKDQYISGSSYLQKVQKTDPPIFIQAITRGMGVLNVEIYDRNGYLKSTTPMVITVDAAVNLPYIRNDLTIDVSTFTEGVYCAVISCNGVKLRISEWFDVQQIHEGTLLFEFSHTTNKYYTYFTGANPILRVEGRLLAWSSDSDYESYTDEFADDEVLDGIPYQKRKLRIIDIPDWMDNKLNKILLLNRCKIEGIYYSRTPGEKKEMKEYEGHDMKSYLYDIRRSKNDLGLSTDDGGAGGSTDDLTVIWTLDGSAWGMGDGSELQIETE